MKQRGTPIITPADGGHRRSADAISAATTCVNVPSPPAICLNELLLRWRSGGAIQGFEKPALCTGKPPAASRCSGAPGALIPPEKKGLGSYRRLVLMQMMRGTECCLVIVVQRSGSLLLRRAPPDVATSRCFDVNPSHLFPPPPPNPLFCHTKVLPGILTKHCCILPDGNAGKGLQA